MSHTQTHVYTCDQCSEVDGVGSGDYPTGWFRIGEVAKDPKKRPRRVRHVCSQACALKLIEKETAGDT